MKNIIRAIVILLVLTAFGFGVAVIVEKNKDTNPEPMQAVAVVAQDPFLSQPTPALAPPTNTGNAQILPPSPKPAPPVAPEPLPVPPAVEPAPVSKPTPAVAKPLSFKSSTGLKVALASNWYPQEEVRDGKTYLVFYSSNTAVVSSIEAFHNPSETLESIEQQLKSSPSVLGIKKVVVDGEPALQYQTNQGTLLAFIKDGTVFYALGALATDYARIGF